MAARNAASTRAANNRDDRDARDDRYAASDRNANARNASARNATNADRPAKRVNPLSQLRFGAAGSGGAEYEPLPKSRRR